MHYCFQKNSALINEVERIFYSQFKEAESYLKIVNIVKESLCSMEEISVKLQKKSGGSLSNALKLLEDAEIISSYYSFDRNRKTKFVKYRLSDEFLNFFFKYVEPHLDTVKKGVPENYFNTISVDSFKIWLGFAFERFCLKHALFLAEKMGFADKVIKYGPLFSKKDNGFQIDLMYERVDSTVTICEVKYHNSEVKTSVIGEMERKLEKIFCTARLFC